MRVEIIESKKEWNDFVKNCKGSTFYHLWETLNVMEKHARLKDFAKKFKIKNSPNMKLYTVGVYKNRDLLSVFPFYLFSYMGTNFVFSPPLSVECHYLGPIIDTENMVEYKKQKTYFEIIEKINKFLDENFKLKLLIKIKTVPSFYDYRGFKWLNYRVEPLNTIIIPVNKNPNYIWKNASRSFRRKVKQAEKCGISVENGNLEDLKILYKIMKKRGRINCSIDYLYDIYENIKKYIKLFVAKKDGEIVGGILTVFFNKKVYEWIGAPKTLRKISPNGLLRWHAINYAYENGYEAYDLIGADNYGLYENKSEIHGRRKIYIKVEKRSPLIEIPIKIKNMFKKM